MAYTLISDLDTSRDNWLIKVRVFRMWEFKTYKQSNEMISFDIVDDLVIGDPLENWHVIGYFGTPGDLEK